MAQDDGEFPFSRELAKDVKIGLKTGLTRGNIDFDDDNFNSGKSYSFNFNLSYEHSIFDDIVSSEIVAEYLIINGKDFSHFINLTNQTEPTIKLDYIGLGYKPRIYMIPYLTGPLKFYLYGGIFGSYLISSDTEKLKFTDIEKFGLYQVNGFGVVLKISKKSYLELERGNSKFLTNSGIINGFDIRSESRIFSVGYKLSI